MRHILPTLLVIFAAAAGLAAQTAECALGVDAAPALRGLRLGMSPAEAGRATGLGVGVGKDGSGTYFKNYIKRRAKGRMRGTRAVYLRFYKNRLFEIEFFLEPEEGRPTLAGFVREYSDRHGLDPDIWRIEHGYAGAVCAGFTLEADQILNPHIQLTDTAAAEALAREREDGT